MNIKYYNDLEQGTDEWLKARLGLVTASEINNLVTPKGKKASGEKVQAYACDIASQRVNQRIGDNFQSYAMMRGSFLEEYARDLYAENYEPVVECGFIVREFDTFKLGCSPDGLIGDHAGIEIKSFAAKSLVATIVSGEVPAKCMNQCQAFLIATNREWVDYVQYAPEYALFVKRVYPDKERQDIIINALESFEELVKKCQSIYETEAKNMVETEYVECTFGDTELAITESGTEGE